MGKPPKSLYNPCILENSMVTTQATNAELILQIEECEDCGEEPNREYNFVELCTNCYQDRQMFNGGA